MGRRRGAVPSDVPAGARRARPGYALGSGVSRTRLIRPSFFADERMARLSDRVRMFYIGLWTQTDDAGYFDWSPSEIGAELYRYLSHGRRTKLTIECLAALVEVGRVVHLDCIEHGLVPTIPDHRIKGGDQSFTIRRRHETRCLRGADVALRSPTSDYVSVSVSDSSPAPVSIDAHARRKMDDAAQETGGWVASHAANRHGRPA